MIGVYPRYTPHTKLARNSRRLDECLASTARHAPTLVSARVLERARGRRHSSRSIARRRRRARATERGPRGEAGKGTIPTFPRRRHDDDRDLRDDERAIDDVGGGGERTNEIVRAVWRRREG